VNQRLFAFYGKSSDPVLTNLKESPEVIFYRNYIFMLIFWTIFGIVQKVAWVINADYNVPQLNGSGQKVGAIHRECHTRSDPVPLDFAFRAGNENMDGRVVAICAT